MTVQQAEAKVQDAFNALIAGTGTAGDLEAAAHTMFHLAWTDGDRKAIARAESKIWDAVALGSRRGK